MIFPPLIQGEKNPHEIRKEGEKWIWQHVVDYGSVSVTGDKDAQKKRRRQFVKRGNEKKNQTEFRESVAVFSISVDRVLQEPFNCCVIGRCVFIVRISCC